MKVRLSSLRAYIQETLLSEADREVVDDNPDIVFNLQELQKLDNADLRKIDRDVTYINREIVWVDIEVNDTIKELKLWNKGGAPDPEWLFNRPFPFVKTDEIEITQKDEEGYDKRRAIINALENVRSIANATRERLKSFPPKWNFVAVDNILFDTLDQFLTDIDELTETIVSAHVVKPEDVDAVAAEVLNLLNNATRMPKLAYTNVKIVLYESGKAKNRKR
jgi:hypothetical protein